MIDGHVHVWSSDMRADPWAPHNQAAPPAMRGPAERLFTEMGTVGVDGAGAIQPGVYGYDHAYLRTTAASSGGRIAGSAS